MANFLFWNTNGNNIPGIIAQACADYEVDVLILAEFHLEPEPLLMELRERTGRTYLAPFETSAKLTFVTRYPLDSLIVVHDESGVAARRIRPPVGREVLVVAMHLPSRRYSSVDEQAFNAIRISRTIDELEERTGHSNSLIIGDLNMDPFDNGLAAADAFHGVMDRSIAREVSRIVSGQERKFFYNPMWSRYGDGTTGPPGTYFYRGGQVSHFWHMFGQVLLRPSLLDYYSHGATQIVEKIGEHSLLKDGRIDNRISDHLPIFLRLDLERGV
jgi:hypothetical protein